MYDDLINEVKLHPGVLVVKDGVNVVHEVRLVARDECEEFAATLDSSEDGEHFQPRGRCSASLARGEPRRCRSIAELRVPACEDEPFGTLFLDGSMGSDEIKSVFGCSLGLFGGELSSAVSVHLAHCLLGGVLAASPRTAGNGGDCSTYVGETWKPDADSAGPTRLAEHLDEHVRDATMDVQMNTAAS